MRATLGVPFVNLIWRHLATIQGGLAWAWTLVKPLYVSGELVSRAAETSALVRFPSLAPLPDFVWDGAAILRADRQVIVKLIDSYNHANGVNFLALLVAISALREGLPMPVGTARVAPKATGYGAEADALPALPGFVNCRPPCWLWCAGSTSSVGSDRATPSQAYTATSRTGQHSCPSPTQRLSLSIAAANLRARKKA